ncbi:MAG TPA: glyoxylate/hydroxypyruvate reductase A [Burkholderiales bacterium]
MNLLFASKIEPAERWLPLLERALPQDRIHLEPRADIDVALVAAPPKGTFGRLPKLKLVQSLWMGVEKLLEDPELPRDVPFARMVDPGMVAAMSETVLAHVLDWHRHFWTYRLWQGQKKWKQRRQFMAQDRMIGILGLGELGTDAAQKLLALGFRVCGWSRRPKSIPGVHCSTDLDEVLAMSDAIVCLLPLTAQTRGILDKRALARMRKDGALINVARGGHVVVPDLIAALDSRHLAHAYLDVFDSEPLPADSPLWTHPGVTVTPHIAALTEPRTAVPSIVANVERVRRGERPLHLVDFAAGY